MAPSPAQSDQQARVIRELARELQNSPHSLPSPSPSPVERDDNDESYRSPPGSSAFEPTQDALMSTQQLDDYTNTRPVIRSSARRFGYYQPPPLLPNVDTSMVAKEFGDFDQDRISADDSISIEVSRGGKKSTQNTPGRSRPSGDLSSITFSGIDHDSLYEATPPSLSRANTRKSIGVTSNLRRDAQIRRASTIPQNDLDASRVKTTIPERRRSTLSQMHTKVVSEEELSFNEERPPTVTNTFKSTRFGASRQFSQNTPQRKGTGTPKSGPGTGNATQQSFMLPDLPNLTELVAGVFADGTPILSKTTKARSRFSSAPNPSRFSNARPKFPVIESVPISAEERALFTSLQLLREKIAELENHKADAEKIIQQQDAEIAKLSASNSAQQVRGGRLPSFGSTGDVEGHRRWSVEKIKLEATVETLRARLERAERKLSVHDTAQKDVTADRDSLYQQLSVAVITSEELKEENDALQNENQTLRDEIDALRHENAALREGDDEPQSTRSGRDANQHNRDQHYNGEQQGRRFRRTQDIHSKVERRGKAEYAVLKAENDALRLQLTNAETQRDEERDVWAEKEKELRMQLDAKNDTLRLDVMGVAQTDINETLRQDNESLRIQLMELTSQRDHERQQWADKEVRLRHKVEKRGDIGRATQDLSGNEIQRPVSTRGSSRRVSVKGIPSNELSTRAYHPRDKDTQTRIADRVIQEVRKSRSEVAPHRQSAHASRSRSKSTRRENGRTNASNQSLRRASEVAASSHDIHPPSESESTTDLSIPRVRGPTSAPHVARTTENTITQSEAMDLTYLSFMGRDEIAQLRKTLEEERAASKRRTSLPVQPTTNDTEQSNVLTKASQHGLPRKSSMKDVTKTKTINIEEATRKSDLLDNISQRIDESIISNSSRRRRSAPIDITSAFIIPDITIRIPQHSHPLGDMSTHEAKNCTMCSRATAPTQLGALAGSRPATAIPTPVPVSSRDDLGPDATIRPSQPPKDALAQVLKELEDELAHLKMELAVQEELLQSHDPALGRRQRKAVQARIYELLKTIDVRFDQIYALYDVLEGQKAEGLLDGRDDKETNRKHLSEQEIDDTLRSVGLDPQEARKGKRVTINEVDDTEDSLPEGSEPDEELPWEGISDAESTQNLYRNTLRLGES